MEDRTGRFEVHDHFEVFALDLEQQQGDSRDFSLPHSSPSSPVSLYLYLSVLAHRQHIAAPMTPGTGPTKHARTQSQKIRRLDAFPTLHWDKLAKSEREKPGHKNDMGGRIEPTQSGPPLPLIRVHCNELGG